MFKLGLLSRYKLKGVHPDLVRVVKKAIEISKADFTVYEGLRTKARQAEYVKTGRSWTLNSRHLTGHAVDLVPYVNGINTWDWPLCFKIAEAMRDAAKIEGVEIVWGGCWDKPLRELACSPENECAAYVLRRQAIKKKANIDGPHFELSWKKYPA